MENQADRG